MVSVGVGGMERIAETAREAGWEVRAVESENWLVRIRRRGVGAADLMLVEEDYQRTAFERSRPEALAGGNPGARPCRRGCHHPQADCEQGAGRCGHRVDP